MQTVADVRGVGVKNRGKCADVLCGQPPIQIRRGRFERRFSLTLYVKVQKYEKVSNFLICGANDVVKHYEIFIKILYGCPFEGRY